MSYKFPYSNLHELNLDWILEQVKKFAGLIPSMETAQADVDEAISSAQTATTTADEAIDLAHQATTNAQSAITTANEAITTAEQAIEIAEQATGGALPSDTPPLMDGTASAGQLATYSRSDHVHPTDTSRASQADITTLQTSVSQANTNAQTAITTANEALETAEEAIEIAEQASGGAIPSDTPPLMNGTASAGQLATYSRSDHVHPSDTSKLSLDGTQANVNPISNLNDFITGLAIFDPAGNITNLPNNNTWWLIVSSGNGINTATQIAYPLSASYTPMTRTMSGGSWSSWKTIQSNEKGSITLSSSWSGSNPYYQTVTISGATITANSKIDLQPTETQLNTLINAGVTALGINNNNGTLTAYALGATPSTMTIQCTVTEVTA